MAVGIAIKIIPIPPKPPALAPPPPPPVFTPPFPATLPDAFVPKFKAVPDVSLITEAVAELL